ncbi:MAG: hypothetical protein KAU46_12595 [Candidatus Aminicenantes bacterium]|nr:hypothetical protein [Candidatus Aminicenantes bacterium]
MMRKITLLLLSLLIFSSVIFVQTIIENPEKSLSKNAGRVLRLQEVFRITDESDDFYFKAPHSLNVDSAGNFFVIDENQILKFSADGKFLKNLLKKGRGPGEISTRYHRGLSYFFLKNDIFLYDQDGSKIIHMNGDGNLIEEIKLKVMRLSGLYGLTDKGFIFMVEAPANIGPTGFKDVDMSVISVSKDGSSSRKVMAFPKKVYSSRNFGMDWAGFYALFNSESQQLFVSHTCEYQIVLADMGKGQVIKRFNRKYRRIKYVKPEGLEKSPFYREYKPPIRKYENDILGLFFYEDYLWVKTSIKHKDKGILIDVFNDEGQYLDNFFLRLNGNIMIVHDDFLFVREKDEDENLQLVKYKIIE